MRVTLHLRALATSEGGRKTSFVAGYRPLWDLGDPTENGERIVHGGRVVSMSRSEIAPGGDADVVVEPLDPENWRAVEPGRHIAAYEGKRQVAEAIVLRVEREWPCACCGYATILEEYDICPVCGWEADGAQEQRPDLAGGANSMSLIAARRAFATYGSKAEGRATRPPTLEERRGHVTWAIDEPVVFEGRH